MQEVWAGLQAKPRADSFSLQILPARNGMHDESTPRNMGAV